MRGLELPVSLLSRLEAVEQAVDAVLAEDLAGAPGPVQAEAQRVAGRIRNKTAAVDVGLAAAFDASKEWMADGSRSAAAWMVSAGREARSVAGRRVKVGRLVRGMPRAWAALARGEITLEHVEELTRVREGREALFADSERKLVDKARTMRFVAFRRDLRYWRDQVDPDAADDRARRQLADRRWHASKTFEDQLAVDGWMDPIGGSIYLRELERLTDWLFEQDWAEAVARLGERNVTSADLTRTAAQRRHDAQVLMAERSGAMTLGAGMLRPVLNVVIDWATFCAELARREGRTDVQFPDERTCRLDDGTVVAPSQALSLGLAGHVRGIVLDPEGDALNYGQARRCFTGDARTAAVLTHDWCGHPPGCDEPSWRCQIDHLVPFVDLGPTAPYNADPKCKPHNRWKERLDAEIRRRRRWRQQRLPDDAEPSPRTGRNEQAA